MISVEEVFHFMQQYAVDFGTAQVALEDTPGRILREPIRADRDFPPFDRVTKDGIALKYEAIEKGLRQFTIQDIQAAGQPQKELSDPKDCLEVMTGAIMPKGTDTVIPYEEVEIKGNIAMVTGEQVRPFINLHLKASDAHKGDLLMEAPLWLRTKHINTLATVGKFQVTVAKLPRVAVISTGDELVEVEESPELHQIRRSNVYALKSLLREEGIRASHYHLKDEQQEIRSKLAELLETYDVLLLSGGVSKGKYDFLPECLEQLGVKKIFHFVKQRPGKPFWFGAKGNKRVFAFPGNPISTKVCYLLYFRAWLGHSTGLALPFMPMQLAEHTNSADFYHLRLVKAFWDGQKQLLEVEEVNISSSGDLVSLNEANGLLCIPGSQSTTRQFFVPFSREFYAYVKQESKET